jgi:hypothetical protein
VVQEDWRHEGERFGADPHNLSHLLGRGRANDELGGAAIEASCLDEIGFRVARIGDPAARTDCRLDPFERRVDLH